jgi:hypothetical protein
MIIQYTAKNINITSNVVEKKAYETIFLGIKVPTKTPVIQTSISMEIEPSVEGYLRIGDIVVDRYGVQYIVTIHPDKSILVSSIDKIEEQIKFDTKGEFYVIFQGYAEGSKTPQGR